MLARRAILAVSWVLLNGPQAHAQQQAAPTEYETRLSAAVNGCLRSVEGTPVAHAFETVPLGEPYQIRRSITAIASPELAGWFPPEAMIRDNVRSFSEGLVFVWVQDNGQRCRVMANSESPVAEIALRTMQTQSSRWSQTSPTTWRSERSDRADLRAAVTHIGLHEVIVDFVRAPER